MIQVLRNEPKTKPPIREIRVGSSLPGSHRFIHCVPLSGRDVLLVCGEEGGDGTRDCLISPSDAVALGHALVELGERQQT